MDRYEFESDRSPKRRRVNGTSSRHDSRYSSPDELAADSDHDDIYVKRPSNAAARRDSNDIRRKSYTDSAGEESPDELDHTVHTFYRGARGRGHTASSTPSSRRQSAQTARVRASPPRTKPYAPYKQKVVLRGHKKGVAAVKFSPDGQRIASCCRFY